MYGTKVKDPVDLTPTSPLLTDAYAGGWQSRDMLCEGLAVLEVRMTLSGTAVTSVTLKPQGAGDDEDWRDLSYHDADDAPVVSDPKTFTPSQAAGSYELDVRGLRRVRFLALKVGGDTDSALNLTVLGGGP
jgi:hypothetical protein